MGLEKLIKKGRKTISTLGILGMLGGGFACSTFTEGEVATIAGEVLVEEGKSDLERLAGRALLTLGTMKHQKEVAEAGRTQIIYQNVVDHGGGEYAPKEGYMWVNSEDPKDLRVKPVFGSAFSFRWVDYNGSGKMDDANELIGPKNRFKQDESFCLLLYYLSEEPFHQKMTIYSPKGIGVLTSEMDYRTKYSVVTTPESDPNFYHEIKDQEFTKQFGIENRGMILTINRELIRWLLNRYGEGEYNLVCWVDGKIKDSLSFDIIY